MKKFVIISILSITFFCFLFIATINNKWGRTKTIEYIQNIAKKNNLSLKIEEIYFSPTKVHLKNLEINDIKIKKTSFRIPYSAFFKKKLILNRLHCKDIFIKTKQTNPKPLDGINFPTSLRLNKFNLKNIHLNTDVFSIKGTVNIKKDLKDFLLKINISKKNDTIHLLASKSMENVNVTLNINMSNLLGEFSPQLTVNVKGLWKSFENLILKKPLENPILGNVFGKIYVKSFEKYNLENIKINSDFQIQELIHFSKFSIRNNFFKLLGHANITTNLEIKNLRANLSTKDFSFFNIPATGEISSIIGIENNKGSFLYEITNGSFKGYLLKNFKGSLLFDTQHLNGKLLASLDFLNEKVNISSLMKYQQKSVKLKNFKITSPSLDGSANLTLSKRITGKSNIHFNNLNLISKLFNLNLGGICDLNFNFFEDKNLQNTEVNAKLSNYFIKDLFGEKLTFKFFLKGKEFNLHSTIKNSTFQKIKIASASFTTSNNSFNLQLNGLWKTPLEIKSNGFWAYDKNITLNIQDISGILLSHPFLLKTPTELVFGKNMFALKNFELSMPSSSLNADILFSQTNNHLKLIANHFPIDFLSFNPLEVNISGFSSIEALIYSNQDVLDGNVSIALENIKISSMKEIKPTNLTGNLSFNIKENTVVTKADVKANKNETIKVDLTLPIDFSSQSYKLAYDKPINGEIEMRGKIEDVLDFTDLGNHRLEGDIDCRFLLSSTISNPIINGFCNLKNGIYENYYTNTLLKNLTFNITSQNQEINLNFLKAQDDTKGVLTLSGKLELTKDKKYPFSLNADLVDLSILQTDFITTKTSGNLQINGNGEKSLISGDIIFTNANFLIPDQIPQKMPPLNVKFSNKKEDKKIDPKQKYPIDLQVKLKASDNIFVKGKGIDAQLKGNLTLTGTYYDPILDGKLELVKGSYLFSGRTFNLTEGSLLFPSKPNIPPYLSIKAETTQEGILITASLQGPLNAFKLSFSSSPTLPMSSIISILLFGKDLSGISGLQALQLATTLASLSEGGGVLESTKRNLGIDRLSIISKTGETADDPDKIAVEVGKYITRGLLVTLKQGTEEGTTNAGVEIDLGFGFIFQLETIREEEQTRGALKWSHNF